MKTLKIILLFLIVALISTACKKNESIIDNGVNSGLKTDYVNPYDSIGILHNIFVDYVLSNNLLSEDPSDMYIDAIRGLENKGIIGNWPDYTVVDSIWAPIKSYIVDDTTYSLKIYSQDLYSDGIINLTQRNWFYRLDTIIIQKFGLQSFSSYITTFDNDLHDASNLTNTQKTRLFIASAVAKHSGEYWASYANLKEGGHIKWWQWGLIIAADVSGVVAGAPILPPWGGVAGGSCASSMAYGLLVTNN